MKTSFLALLCVSVFTVTDATAEITAAPATAACTTPMVTATAGDNATSWFKRKNKKRRPAYRRLRAHRR